MKGILSFLLLFLVTHVYGQSRVCSYLSSCGSCASFNTSSINYSSDPSCFSTLASSGGFENGMRFRSVIDQYEISYQSQGQSGIGIGVIAATIDRAYREHQARQTLSTFYKNLPEMLEAHHSKLMESLEQQRIEKQDLYPEKTLSLEREYQQIGERLKNITAPSARSQDGAVLPEIEEGISSREIVKRLEQDDFLRSFPSLADDIIPDRGAREERRNLKIQDEDIKRLQGENELLKAIVARRILEKEKSKVKSPKWIRVWDDDMDRTETILETQFNPAIHRLIMHVED